MSTPNPATTAYIRSIKGAARAVPKFVHADELTDEQANFQAYEGGWTIHWLVGHLMVEADFLLCAVTGEEPTFGNEHNKYFGLGTKPDPKAEGYPALKDILNTYKQFHESALDKLKDMPDEKLDVEFPGDNPVSQFFKSPRRVFEMYPFHNAYHLGEITALRRIQGLKGGLGF